MYKVMKVFDCQDMPENLREKFFEFYSDYGKSNDSCVTWEIGSNSEPEETEKLIDMWLVLNGADRATEDNCGEEVLIRYWW